MVATPGIPLGASAKGRCLDSIGCGAWSLARNGTSPRANRSRSWEPDGFRAERWVDLAEGVVVRTRGEQEVVGGDLEGLTGGAEPVDGLGRGHVGHVQPQARGGGRQHRVDRRPLGRLGMTARPLSAVLRRAPLQEGPGVLGMDREREPARGDRLEPGDERLLMGVGRFDPGGRGEVQLEGPALLRKPPYAGRGRQESYRSMSTASRP